MGANHPKVNRPPVCSIFFHASDLQSKLPSETTSMNHNLKVRHPQETLIDDNNLILSMRKKFDISCHIYHFERAEA